MFTDDGLLGANRCTNLMQHAAIIIAVPCSVWVLALVWLVNFSFCWKCWIRWTCFRQLMEQFNAARCNNLMQCPAFWFCWLSRLALTLITSWKHLPTLRTSQFTWSRCNNYCSANAITGWLIGWCLIKCLKIRVQCIKTNFEKSQL